MITTETTNPTHFQLDFQIMHYEDIYVILLDNINNLDDMT